MRELFEYYLFWIVVIVVVIVIAFIVYAVIKIKNKIWDTPQDTIRSLEREIRDSRRLVIRFLNDYCQQDFSDSDRSLDDLIDLIVTRSKFTVNTDSSLKAIPYMAAIMADYDTLWLKKLANQLDWGGSARRQDKVASLNEIRRISKEQITNAKVAQYQLAYLLELFPSLEDVIETDYSELPVIDEKALSEYDNSRDFLSKEEYLKLSPCERNQLALDRYRSSHSKTKWQIGRDYELYTGYRFSKKGYKVDYFGSYMGLEDLGRDLIAKKEHKTLIIQCKYWSQEKKIHEKHINQLYGTLVCYCIEHHIDQSSVTGVLVTNIELSPTAIKMAKYLGIEYVEHFELGEYPCIKCNVGKDEYGLKTKIYHLPFDQQYDRTIINEKDGDFMAMTVKEAEDAGFRRAYKYFGGT